MKRIITFRDVSFSYPNSEPVLKGLTLDVMAGDFVLVVGSSGCGKSTFLRLINGLIPHFSGGEFSGRVSVCGKDTRENTTKSLAPFVGFVFQDPENQTVMSTVESEIAFGLENMGFSSSEISSRIEWICEKLKIGHLLGRQVGTLSGGERQKVILGSVMAPKPAVLVLDEPTSQLDPQSAREFLQALALLNREGLTIVLSEHRVERVLGYANRVFDMDQGIFGKPEDVLQNSGYLPPFVDLWMRLKKRGLRSRMPTTLEQAKKAYGNLKFKRKPNCRARHATKPFVELVGVSKKFSGKNALNDVNLSLGLGEFVAVVGPNGCGKTTLVKHMNGLLRPDRGRVLVGGTDAGITPVEELARTVGFVSQNPNDYLFQDTLYDELKFSLDCIGVGGDIESTLEYVGLSHLQDRYPRDLSGGERQLAAIASVLVSNPKFIVFDEPTRGVDHDRKVRLLQLLQRLWLGGKTVVLVTHDIESIASYVERVVYMENGSVLDDGPPLGVLSSRGEFAPSLARLFPGRRFASVDEVMGCLK